MCSFDYVANQEQYDWSFFAVDHRKEYALMHLNGKEGEAYTVACGMAEFGTLGPTESLGLLPCGEPLASRTGTRDR